MSSSELLDLLDELPSESKFKEASERTFWVVEYCGDDAERVGELSKLPVFIKPPPDVRVVTDFVDWTHDRKILARNASETAALRAKMSGSEPDFTGLIEPLHVIIEAHQKKKETQRVARARRFLNL